MLIKTVLLRFFRGVDREGAALLEKSTSLVSSLVNGALLAAAWLSIGLDAPLWVPLAATGVFVAKSVLELYLMIRYEREM